VFGSAISYPRYRVDKNQMTLNQLVEELVLYLI